jgi:hypothetical protein
VARAHTVRPFLYFEVYVCVGIVSKPNVFLFFFLRASKMSFDVFVCCFRYLAVVLAFNQITGGFVRAKISQISIAVIRGFVRAKTKGKTAYPI